LAKAISVQILGDASQFQRELDKAAGSTKKFGKVAGVLGGVLAGGLAVGLEKSVKAAMDAQVSTARLDQAFKTAGMSADNYKTQIDKAEESSRNLGFAGNETKTALGSFMVATHDVTKSVKDLAIAEDLARFKNISLEAATKMLTSATAGNARAIKQLGIMVQPVTSHVDALKNAHISASTAAGRLEYAHAKLADKMATAAKSVDMLRQKVEGQGEAFTHTAAGSMQVFHEKLQNLEVVMGTMLLPAIEAVTNKLSDFAGFLAKHTTLAKGLAIGLAVVAGGLLAVAAAETIASLAFLASPVGLVIAGLVLLGVAIVEAVKHWDQIKQKMENVWNWIKDHMPLIGLMLAGPFGFAAGEIFKHWDQIKNTTENAVGAVRSVVSTGFEAVKSAVTTALNVLTNTAQSVWGKIVSIFHGAVGGIRSAVGAIVGAFQPVIDALQTLIRWAEEVIKVLSRIHVPSLPGSGGKQIFGGGKALGGAIAAGTSYLVGESGPEMFMSGSAGTIIPNNRLGGGGIVVNVTVNGPALGTTAAEVADTIRRELLRTQGRNSGLGFAT
jgi:phage-related protein